MVVRGSDVPSSFDGVGTRSAWMKLNCDRRICAELDFNRESPEIDFEGWEVCDSVDTVS